MQKVKELLRKDPYNYSQKDKNKELLLVLKNNLKNNYNNNYLKSYYKKIKFNIQDLENLSEIPMVPASMFKIFDLSTVNKDKITTVLNSSSTTGQSPSKIALDKTTAFRQSIALHSILKNYIGKNRIPMLVFDIQDSILNTNNLSARGAGIKGFSSFASEVYYLLNKDNEGNLILNVELLKNLENKFQNSEIFLFGFTYLLWEIMSKTYIDKYFKFHKIKIFHGGGWKKLEYKNIKKNDFNELMKKSFSCDIGRIHDFYGMVEQTGVIFIDCEEGNKHVPIFAEVFVRDLYTLKPIEKKEGLINILSAIPISYPGQSILTEDKGIILGTDNCKCGRNGKYFRFTSRVKKSEIRGCGDTISETKLRK